MNADYDFGGIGPEPKPTPFKIVEIGQVETSTGGRYKVLPGGSMILAETLKFSKNFGLERMVDNSTIAIGLGREDRMVWKKEGYRASTSSEGDLCLSNYDASKDNICK